MTKWPDHRPPNGAAQRFFRETVLPFQGEECLIWPFYRDDNGYGRIRSGKGQHTVSRVAARVLLGEPPSPKHDAAHLCGNGHLGCVNPRHVVWKTRIENMADMGVHGTRLDGEKNPHAKLTADDVRAIRSARGSVKIRQLASTYGIGESAVSAIHTGRRWSSVA